MAVQRWVYIKYFCALSVVVCHLCKLIYLGPVFSQFFDFGTYAVAVFFFLSGYGLTYFCIYKKNYLKDFLKKRLLKIFLIYFIATLLWVVLSPLSIHKIIRTYEVWQILSVYPILPYGWYFVVLMFLYLILSLHKMETFCLDLYYIDNWLYSMFPIWSRWMGIYDIALFCIRCMVCRKWKSLFCIHSSI